MAPHAVGSSGWPCSRTRHGPATRRRACRHTLPQDSRSFKDNRSLSQPASVKTTTPYTSPSCPLMLCQSVHIPHAPRNDTSKQPQPCSVPCWQPYQRPPHTLSATTSSILCGLIACRDCAANGTQETPYNKPAQQLGMATHSTVCQLLPSVTRT
jgi:hypothetical protein